MYKYIKHLTPSEIAEMSLVGCLIIDTVFINEVAGELTADDFTSDSGIIFQALLNQKDNKTIDFVTILAEIGEQYKSYLMQCYDIVPKYTDAYKKYLEIVKNNSVRRKVEKQIYEMQKLIYEQADISLLQAESNKLSQIMQNTDNKAVHDIKDCLLEFMRTKGKPKEYIKLGYSSLDRLSFIDKGDYIVIGGRTSAGKTAFVLNLIAKLARTYNVGFFSLETNHEKLTDRFMTTYAGLDFAKVKQNKLNDDDWISVSKAAPQINKLKYKVINAAGKNVAWIQSVALQYKFDIIFIDYLGLIKAQGKSQYEKVTNISIDLHTMAQSTGITVFALSQLNRAGIDVPTMTDLRDSGQIEQDADLILLLHNDKEHNKYYVIIAKNKEGEVGKVEMHFDGARQTFTEIEVRR